MKYHIYSFEKLDVYQSALQLSVDRIFPLAPKVGIKKGFIKNINIVLIREN